MASATISKGEVQARKSLVPQIEALGFTLEVLPSETRERFRKILNAYLDARNDDERCEILIALQEMLDPDGSIDTKTVFIQNWLNENPQVVQFERELGAKKKIFSTTLERLMKEARLTQKDLAEKLSVTPSTISQIASGKHKPQPETLKRLAEVLGCTVEALWPNADHL